MSGLRLRFQTLEYPHFDVHLRTLRDKQQFSDDDDVAADLGISSANWPIFGVLWASGRVLARLMVTQDIQELRILEFGCGIGLASLVLNRRDADITATDRHPSAQAFMNANTTLNEDEPIDFVRTGWANEDTGLGTFDLIIGSDVLYEAEHVGLVAAFIERHANPTCEVVLVDPSRGLHARFSKRMVSLGYEHEQRRCIPEENPRDDFRGVILGYKRSA